MASKIAVVRPIQLRRYQAVAVTLLFLAGLVNYLDRSSFGIANSTIRADLGLSGTHVGALLSVFALVYGITQLPIGFLLDHLGARVILGTGMLVWSLAQMATGLVSSFSYFLATRVGLAAGEAPFMPSGIKIINDWFPLEERGLPVGILNASSSLGQALAPPLLTGVMLALGWRSMFVVIGSLGLLLAAAWYLLYRDREQAVIYPEVSDHASSQTSISGAAWRRLFQLRTVWGMMIGFGGVNYTVWLYVSWLPAYLQAEHHLTIAATGRLAAIPFFCGALGMLVSGLLADRLVRHGSQPMQSRKFLTIAGMVLSAASTLAVVQASGVVGAVLAASAALFFIQFAGTSAWGLVQVSTPPRMVASVSAIQNFGSFVFASLAPVLTGWLLDRTHSFRIALLVCSSLTLLGALSYLWVVKDPIRADPPLSVLSY